MPRELPPDPFSHSDRPVYDIYIANRASAALAVAVRLGVFQILAERPLTLHGLCGELHLERRPIDALLTVLVSLGLLRREGEGFGGPLGGDGGPRYVLTQIARDHLLPESPFYLGGLIDIENEHFVTPMALMEAMGRNKPQAYGDRDPWQTMLEDPEAAVSFTRAMHSISVRPAFGLAAAFEFANVRNLLDVGGGSGILAVAAAVRNPSLRATVLDLPPVIEVAREVIWDFGVADRVGVVASDMFKDPLPSGHDAILLSQILHDWPPQAARLLLRKVLDVLTPGGRVLIHEKLLNDRRDGPLANALVSVDMLFWTEGQQYSAPELHQLLQEAGFKGPETRPTVGYWSVTWAAKAPSTAHGGS